MQSLKKIPHVRLAAVCDVYDGAFDAGRQLADPKRADAEPLRKKLLHWQKDTDLASVRDQTRFASCRKQSKVPGVICGRRWLRCSHGVTLASEPPAL